MKKMTEKEINKSVKAQATEIITRLLAQQRAANENIISEAPVIKVRKRKNPASEFYIDDQA